MSDLARATLPVALALLIFAGVARAVLWARVDDLRAQRLARRYLEPLATWCLIAVAAHVLALGAAGELAVMTLVLPFVVGTVAMLLRTESAAPEAAAEAAVATPAPATTPAPAAAPAPARVAPPSPTGSLWAGRDTDETAREGALWSR